MYHEVTRLEKEQKYIESDLEHLRHLRDHVHPNGEEVRFISQRLKELPTTLQKTDTYHIHQFLLASVSRIELQGRKLGRVFLVNTAKSLKTLDSTKSKINKGLMSSIEPPSTSVYNLPHRVRVSKTLPFLYHFDMLN